MARLLELIKLGTRASVIPQLLVVGEDFQQGCRKGPVGLLPIGVQAVDLLPDQRIGSEQQGQAPILMPPFFKIREVLQGTGLVRELANVQIFQSYKEGMQFVHDLGLKRRHMGLVESEQP